MAGLGKTEYLKIYFVTAPYCHQLNMIQRNSMVAQVIHQSSCSKVSCDLLQAKPILIFSD